jgi:uncharacterized membrane protein (DUF2068 family)
MRPVGVTIIAVLTWIRGTFFVVIGLVLLVVGHLSARLVSTMATDSFFETLFSRVGKALGFGALLIAVAYILVGLGLWQLKNWARTVTVVLVSIWLLFGLIGLMHFPTPWHIARVLVDGAIVAYLMLPEVRSLFVPA